MRCSLFALMILGISPVMGDADEPSIAYVFPAGGQRGTTVEFRVGGHYLHDQARFEMLGQGVSAVERLTRAPHTLWFEGPVIPLPDSQQKEDYPVEHLGRVEIAAEATPGMRRWRVMTSQGSTASLPFVIGDLPEIVEQEIDGKPIPVPVELPVTINGRIFPRQDVDIWKFAARAGTTYVCDVVASRIGSPLDASLKIVDPHGNVVAENDDTHGKDPHIVFTAATAGWYAVHLWDANHGGLQHYVYRLSLQEGPQPETCFPMGGQRGTRVELQLLGADLPEQSLSIDIPQTAEKRWTVPNSAGLVLDVSDLPELIEQEPNPSAEMATPGQLNAVWNGRIQVPGDVDVWRVDGVQGTPIQFDLRAAELGSPLDSLLTLLDAQGKILAESDDRSPSQSDSALAFTPRENGPIFVRVSDRFARRGGPQFSYRLYVTSGVALQPGFRLNLPSDAVTVPRSGEVKFKITAERLQGFAGPIAVSLDGLPHGVTFAPDLIAANKNDVTLVIRAVADAPVGTARIIVQGRAEHVGQTITATARPPQFSRTDEPPDHLLLAVAVPTPFKVVGEFESKYAARGSTYLRRFRLERGDFRGPVAVSLAERQARHLQGVTGPVIEVPAGIDEFEYPIHLPPWMEIGRTSRTCVMAVGRVTLEDGSQHVVSATSHAQNDQIIILVDPGQLSVRLERSSLLANPGAHVDLPIVVERGADLAGSALVELIVPPHVSGVVCKPLRLSADQSRGTLRVHFPADHPGPFNKPFVVRATLQHRGHPYTAESPLEIVPGEPAQTGKLRPQPD